MAGAQKCCRERGCPKPKTRPSASFVRYLSHPGLPAAPSRFHVNPTEGVSSAAPDLEFRGCVFCERCAAPFSSPTRLPSCDAGYASWAYPKEAGQKTCLQRPIFSMGMSHPSMAGGARRREREPACGRQIKIARRPCHSLQHDLQGADHDASAAAVALDWLAGWQDLEQL